MLKWAMVEKFKDYLWGARVTVVTDNNPLVHLQTAKLGAVEQCWVAQLANYDYQLQYHPGREHANADALSRLPETGGTPSSLELEEGLLVGVVEAPGSHLDRAPPSWGWDPSRWKELQEKDGGLVWLSSYLRRGFVLGAVERQAQTLVLRRLLGQWRRLSLRQGVICHSVQDPGIRETVYDRWLGWR